MWPDSGEQQASTNLRNLLHQIRSNSPMLASLLDTTPPTLRLLVPDDRVDVANFFRLVSDARAGSPETVKVLRRIAAMQPDLPSPADDDEVMREIATRLRAEFTWAMARLVELTAESGELTDAIRFCERLIDLDPLNESAHQRYISLLLAAGDAARAIRAYHRCAGLLADELGISPSPETARLYRRALGQPTSAEPRAVYPPLSSRGDFVGRVRELELMRSVLADTVDGHTSFVLVTGDPGVGKSRLVDEFIRGQDSTACAIAVTLTDEGLPYSSLAQILTAVAVPGADEVHAALEAVRPPQAHAPIPRETIHRLAQEALFSDGRTLVLVLDEFPRIDAESRAFLRTLITDRSRALLVIALARPEELETGSELLTLIDRLRTETDYHQIELEPFSADETQLLAQRAAGRRLSGVEAQRWYRETEGNALFIVEYARMAPDGELGAAQLSPKILGLIRLRLARLRPTTRELAELASVIGRSFDVEVLNLAAPMRDVAFIDALDELWSRRLIRERGSSNYEFSHDKIREALYDSLPPARRMHLHQEIAQALQQVSRNDESDSMSALLGAHFERGGMVRRAVGEYTRAARLSERVGAAEKTAAFAHLAIKALRKLREGRARDRDELELRTLLSSALTALGQDAAENEERLERLRLRLGDSFEDDDEG